MMIRMEKIGKIIPLAVAFALVLTVAGAVSAGSPSTYHWVYGEVSMYGESAPAGTQVFAVINGENVENVYTGVLSGVTDNYYSFDDENGIPQEHDGQTCWFFVEGENTHQSITVSSGSSTELNLTVEDTTKPTKFKLLTPENNTTTSDNTPNLTWEASSDAESGIDHYEVWLDNTSGADTNVDNVPAGTENYLTRELPLDNYFWYVVAVDGSGNTRKSENVFNFEVVAGPSSPNLYSPSDGAILTKDTVTLEWENVSVAENYDLVVDNDSAFSSPVENVTITDNTYTLSGLSDDEYYWKARSRDDQGTVSSWSDAWSFTVDTTAPSLTITWPSDGATISSDNVNVRWTSTDNTSGIDNFEVKLEGGSWTTLTDNTTDNYNFTGLPDGDNTAYVRAVDYAGNSTEDNVSFTVAVGVPTVSIGVSPTMLSESEVGPNNFVVTLTYSENMDTSVDPVVSFDPDVEGTTLENESVSWNSAENVATATYDVADENAEVPGVKVSVSGAQDDAGITQIEKTKENAFDVDTKKPTVQISVSPYFITEDDVGNENFVVTATYDENMDTGADPVISFTPDVTQDTLTLADNYWNAAENVYTWTYDVADENAENMNVDVSLASAQDDAGNTQLDVRKEDAFNIDTKGLVEPIAKFSYSPSSPNPGETVNFDATASWDPDGSIASYEWSFGDGSTATGATVSHSYSSTGDYTVELTVTDDDGATDSKTKTVTVSGAPTPPANQPPDAEAGGPYTVDEGSTVSLDGTGSSDNDGSVESYSWEITDGPGSLEDADTAEPTYVPPEDVDADTDVTVELTATDDDGATDSDTATVTVDDVPEGGFPWMIVVVIVLLVVVVVLAWLWRTGQLSSVSSGGDGGL